nr:glycosyltransferase family 39 protein [Flavobacteriales bacterium]
MNLFSTEQWLLLLGSGTFLLLSIWGFSQKRMSVAVAALTVSALFFYSFVAILDPFLHIWDERFHALVAKNLAHHPLLPTLYDQPIVSIAYDRWDRAVVWLHKQPLFLWQIAASYKLWGFNEFGLRFPSALMSALLIPISYRVGKLLMNDATGYIAAILMMSSFYTVQLVSGVQGMEHNDVAFLFYVSASIWAWVEYEHAPNANKWCWAVLIGLFVGAAVLCKWLVGLLVYAAFSSQLLADFK